VREAPHNDDHLGAHPLAVSDILLDDLLVIVGVSDHQPGIACSHAPRLRVALL
jgi:hypothetical protein